MKFLIKGSLLTFLLTILSCTLSSKQLTNKNPTNLKQKEVTLIKQWHFAPGVDTSIIENFINDPRFVNQLDIYQRVEKLVLENAKESKETLLIAEGCETNIDLKFKKSYNGWDMLKLHENRDDDNFKNIMAPVPMKIKARYPYVKVVCGDDEKLIKDHLLAFSDLKGLIGIYTRLTQSHGEKFKRYHKLLEKIAGKKVERPIEYAMNMAKAAWQRVLLNTHKRNDVFIEKIIKHLNQNPIVIIGGVHVADIVNKLKKKSVSAKVVIPNGYKDESIKLLQAIDTLLNSKLKSMILYQVPEGLKLEDFPIYNQIDPEKIATHKEWEELQKIAKFAGIDDKILTSDFDQDGIRDFTLSQGNGKVYLTAEDNDWDNDGVENLIDLKLAKIKIPLSIKNHYSNTFNINGVEVENEVRLLNEFGVKILSSKKYEHDLLVLKLLVNILKSFPESINRVKLFYATEQKLRYGNNVFFSFVTHTQTMEFYPQSFYRYIQKKRQEFKGVSDKVFVSKVVTPIIIHSLAHELAHSLDMPSDKFFFAQGWKWDEMSVNSKYLQAYRHPRKIMKKHKKHLTFKGKTNKQWSDLYQNYLLARKQYKNKLVISKRWHTGLAIADLEHGFFAMENIPSLYSLTEPNEWYAEMVAGCIWQRLFGHEKSMPKRIEAATRYELLIGFNPYAGDVKFCSIASSVGNR